MDVTVISATPVVRVFGAVDVEASGQSAGIGGPRQRRLLALLAIRGGEVLTIDWLSEYLWSDDDRPDETARALRTYVSRLRQSLPVGARDWLVTERSGYRLVAPPEAIEHLRFASLRASARSARESGDPATAQRMLDTALEMWRGEPFRELEDLDWAQAEIERLRADRLELLEERWETALALGRHTQITGELAAFTTEHPLRERAAGQYALALYRSGRTTEALRVIDGLRHVLAEESGLDPSSTILDLENAILSGDPSLDPAEGAPLRGYRLLEQVGAGAFSVVWRGIQPSVDRPVAVKQIRSEFASRPEFIRRFEAEAHLVARIEHPHIVPLIDYWRDPDAAYLVMRWLSGGTLERMLDDGPLTVARTLDIARQIGAALGAAHAHGIVHRDVKSANVMFDDGGNAFVTDFGIALEAAQSSGPDAALSTGSPAYASPEQLRREPLSAASDIFSMAVVLYECLTGRTPFSDSTSAEMLLDRQLHETPPPVTLAHPHVPERVAAALARALNKDPVDRFRSVDEFVDALEEGVPSPAPPPDSPVLDENPYLGLRAFDEADAGRFFGRTRLVSELVQRMRSPHVLESGALIVVGPSGSGKSSVVRAGLLPALRSGAVEGSETWFTTAMVPRTDPFESLEAALLRIAVNPPASLLAQLRDGPRGILRGVRRCLPDDGDVLVLIVDQLEEVFVGRAAEHAHAFLEALATAVDDPTSPLRLVCTLRADYYHRPLEHPTFAPILKRGAADVTPLAPDEMEEAIVEPARLAGLEFESGLVARIAAETLGQPSPLPLLQHVLAEMYERRTGTGLTIEAYEDLGGVSGALAARAESIHGSAQEAERMAMRRLFGALTDPAEDRSDLRRRVPVADLGDDEAMRWSLDRFGAARLLTFDRDVVSREPTVEVAHEALLREWPRLVRWLDEDRDLLRAIELLAGAASTWDGSGRQPSDLLRGGRLAQALDLALVATDRLRPLDREYLEASRALAEAEREGERRRVRRLRRLNVGVSIALVIALVAGGVAIAQRNLAEQATADAEAASVAALAAEADAERERDAAELAALIGQSDALVDEDPDVATLLALEAYRRSPERSTEQAVLHALSSAPARITSFDLPESGPSPCAAFDNRLTFSNGGRTGFSIAEDRLITVDLATGETADHGPAPASCVQWIGDEEADIRWVTRAAPASEVGASGGGSTQVGFTHWAGTWDGDLREVDIDGAERLLGIVAGDRVLLSGPDRDLLVVDPKTAEVVTRVEASLDFWAGPLWSAGDGDAWAISDDGRFVVVSGSSGAIPSGVLDVLDGRTGKTLHQIPLTQSQAALDIHDGVAFVGGLFGRLTTIDLVSGQVLSDIATTSRARILAIGSRPDGLVVVVSDDRVELVDPARGSLGPAALVEVGTAAVGPDGTVTVIDPDQTRVSTIEMQTTALVESSIEITSGGTIGLAAGRAALVGFDGTVATIDLETGRRKVVDPAQSIEGFEPIVAFPTRDGFAAFGDDAVVARWSGDELAERVRLANNAEGGSFIPERLIGLEAVSGPAQARSGAIIVYGRTWEEWEAHLIDWDEGGIHSRLAESRPFSASSALPAVDGGMHLLNDTGLVRTYGSDKRWAADIATGITFPVAVAHDGAGLIAVGGVGGAVIAEPATGDAMSIPGVGDVAGLEFARNGEALVILERNGGVHLWDVTSQESVGQLWFGTSPVQTSQPWYDAERDTVWVATDGRLLEFSLDPQQWIANACTFVGRDLTTEEWDRYVPGDDPPQAVCP